MICVCVFFVQELRAGSGDSPTIDTRCSCHYAGRLIDGSKSDSRSVFRSGLAHIVHAQLDILIIP